MKPCDTTLLAIAAASRPLQPVQLQKSLFLLARKTPQQMLGEQARYHFKAYDYGPFDSQIYSDAERLEQEGLVTIRRPPEARYKEYAATAAGKQRAEFLKRNLTPEVNDFLEKIVAYTQSVTFNQLVTSIYQEFPEMKENSVFKDQV